MVEEIGIKKTATERTETIQDSVRKTEVEVEDNRNSGLSQARPVLARATTPATTRQASEGAGFNAGFNFLIRN